MNEFIHLLAAELLKTRRRRLDTVLGLVLLVLSVALPLRTVWALSASRSPDASRVIEGLLSRSADVHSWGALMGGLIFFIAPLLAASSVGSEYTLRTWPMLVLRASQRFRHVVAKLVILYAVIVGLVLGSIVVWEATFAITMRLWLGTAPAVASAMVHSLQRVGVVAAAGVFYGTFAVLVTFVTQSALAGAAGGILFPSLLTRLTVPWNRMLMPQVHLTNLSAVMQFGPADGARGLNIPIATSASVLTGYLILMIVLCIYTFDRQELR